MLDANTDSAGTISIAAILVTADTTATPPTPPPPLPTLPGAAAVDNNGAPGADLQLSLSYRH
jgi:hypothetical protein